MRAKLIILSLFASLSFFSNAKLLGQDASPSNKKVDKEVRKQKKAKGKEARKEDKKAIQAHYKAQGKETRKRMKRNERKSKRLKKNRRPPFWKSWFN